MLETVLTLLTISFFARMSPGPDMMLLIRHATSGATAVGVGGEAPKRSYAAYACIIGVCLGLTFHVSLSVLGLALVIKSNPIIFNALRYAGAAYLMYIGWRCFSDTGSIDVTGAACGTTATTVGEGFRDGLFCNLLNPKVTMFILSVFMQLIGPDATISEKAVYGSVIVLEGLVGWTLFVMCLNTSFVQNLYGRHAAKLNKATGFILFALGAAIVISG